MLMCSRNQHNTVKQLSFNKEFKNVYSDGRLDFLGLIN